MTDADVINDMSPAEALDRIREAEAKLGDVGDIPLLDSFLDPEVQDWVDLQEVDIDEAGAPIRDIGTKARNVDDVRFPGEMDVIRKSIARLDDLSDRTVRLLSVKSDARELRDLVTRIRSGIESVRGDLEAVSSGNDLPRDSAGKFVATARDIETDGRDLARLLSDVKRSLDPRAMKRVIDIARRGLRPVRTALQEDSARARNAWQAIEKTIEAVGRPETSATQPEAAREEKPVADSPHPGTGPQPGPDQAGPATLTAARKKELGRSKSTAEIQHGSRTFFKRLWLEGADQERVADILYFVPSSTKGMNVHDLLEYSNGFAILDKAVPEILSRFPAQAKPSGSSSPTSPEP